MVLTVTLDCEVPGQSERLGEPVRMRRREAVSGPECRFGVFGMATFLVDGRGEGVLDWGRAVFVERTLFRFQ